MAEIAIAAAIGAAIASATYTITYLLTPKPKPVEQGRLTGEVQIQDSTYNWTKPIILGGIPLAPSEGGCDPGTPTIAQWHEVDDLSLSDDGSLFKSGGVPGVYDAHAYSIREWAGTQCCDIRWVSNGASNTQRVAVYFEDVLGTTADQHGFQFTLFSGVVPVFQLWKDGAAFLSFTAYDPGCAFRITTDGAGNGTLWVKTGGIPIDENWTGAATFAFDYNTALNYRVHVAIAGYDVNSDLILDSLAAQGPVYLADGHAIGDSYGGGVRVAGNVIYLSDIRKTVTTTQAQGGKGGSSAPPTNTTTYFADLAIKFSEGEMELLALFADSDKMLDYRAVNGVTGGIYDIVPPDEDYTNLAPLDPSDPDVTARTELRFSGAPVYDDNGVLSGTLNDGSTFRFYSGTLTQEPDPILEAYFQSLFPDEHAALLDVTPAHRGDCYMVIENFNVSKYGRIPNVSALLSNRNIKTVEQSLEFLAERVGIDPDTEIDASNMADTFVRGIIITEPPRLALELLGLAYNYDTVDANGLISTVTRGGPIAGTIAVDDLGATDGGRDTGGDRQPVEIASGIELDLLRLPQRLEVTFMDPAKDGESNTIGWGRTETDATAQEVRELGIVLLESEGERLSRRLLTQIWADARQKRTFSVPHTYHAIKPAGRWNVERNLDGGTLVETVRVREVNGFMPGVFEVTAIVEANDDFEVVQIDGDTDPSDTNTENPPTPATTVATFIDRVLRDRERDAGRPGFYVGACSFGNGSWAGANVKRDRGAGLEFVIDLREQATMGIVDATPATVSGASTVDVELYADQTLPTYTAGEVTNGAGYVMQGDLIYQYRTATQLSTTPNKWRLTNISNVGAICSSGENGAHAAGERFVVLNQALKFVAIDGDMVGDNLPYIIPTIGQRDEDAATVMFQCDAPDFVVTTPTDFNAADAVEAVLFTWTPVSATGCQVVTGVFYEIYDITAGTPGTLVYSGNAQPFRLEDVTPGSHTYRIRARTDFADGSYVSDSVTVTAGPTGGADLDVVLVDPTDLTIMIDPTTHNILTES